MKKVTAITGKAESGKGWLAKNLASLDCKNAITVDGRGFDRPFAFTRCNEDTDCIIIDDVCEYQVLNQIMQLVSNGVWIHRMMKDDIHIYPKIIVTFDESISTTFIKNLGSSYTRRFDMIEMIDGVGHRIEL